MQVKSIAECSKGSIPQFFRPSLSYHLSLRSLFCLLLSGCFTQVLLNIHVYFCLGLIEPDNMVETVFQSPPKKREKRSAESDKTKLLSDPDLDDSNANGGAAFEEYTNINLDDDRESEFELL